MSCIDLLQGQTMDFKEFVVLAPLLPLGSIFLGMSIPGTLLPLIWKVGEGELQGTEGFVRCGDF